MRTAAGKSILVVKPNGLGIGGVNTYLADRLPKLASDYGYNITLYFPGEVTVQEQADVFLSAGIDLVAGHIPQLRSLESHMRLRASLDELMSKTQFDIVHVNTASLALEYHALDMAARHGIPVRIAHSHNTAGNQGMAKRLAAPLFRAGVNKSATVFLACSEDAGVYLFGREVWNRSGRLARNGIDVERFSYNPRTRSEVREEMQVHAGAEVFGFVGNLIDQKNPLFLIDVFDELHRQDESRVLWIVGDGPRIDEMKQKVQRSGLSDAVVFFGKRSDVHALMQGMDALLLPSLHEGLGLVLVEAQAAGLPCFASTNVPREARIPGCSVQYLPLDQGARGWAASISSADLSRNEMGSKLVSEAGYSLDDCIGELAEIYSCSIGGKQ